MSSAVDLLFIDSHRTAIGISRWQVITAAALTHAVVNFIVFIISCSNSYDNYLFTRNRTEIQVLLEGQTKTSQVKLAQRLLVRAGSSLM